MDSLPFLYVCSTDILGVFYWLDFGFDDDFKGFYRNWTLRQQTLDYGDCERNLPRALPVAGALSNQPGVARCRGDRVAVETISS